MKDKKEQKNRSNEPQTIATQVDSYHIKHSGKNNTTLIYAIWYNLGSKMLYVEVISSFKINVNIRIFNAI